MRRSMTVFRRIIFFGGDEVSVAVLSALHRRLCCQCENCEADQLEVVCPPPTGTKPSQRGAALKYCEDNGLKHHIVPHASSLRKPDKTGRCFILPSPDDPPRSQPFDVAVVASFRYFIPPGVLKALPKYVVNVHPSLLPKYRGTSPIYRTLRNGDKEGGVTLVKIEAGVPMDCGDVLVQRSFPIPRDMDRREYFTLVNNCGAEALIHVLFGDSSNGSLDMQHLSETWNSATPQPNVYAKFRDDPFYAPRVNRNSGRIVWTCMTSSEAFNVWRATVGTYYMAHSFFVRTATPIAAQIRRKCKLAPARCVFKEAVDGASYATEKLERELQKRAKECSSPGALYFPVADHTVGAVRCRDSEEESDIGWFLWRVAHVEGSPASISPQLMSTGMKLVRGVVYDGVFASTQDKEP